MVKRPHPNQGKPWVSAKEVLVPWIYPWMWKKGGLDGRRGGRYNPFAENDGPAWTTAGRMEEVQDEQTP
jgi:hypothetical protein